MKTATLALSKVMAISLQRGHKSQTRRPVKQVIQMYDFGNGNGVHPAFINPDKHHTAVDVKAVNGGLLSFSPYGKPGDRLRFVTGWAVDKKYDDVRPVDLPTDARVFTWFSGPKKPDWCGRMRMGRHLPGAWRTLYSAVATLKRVRVVRVNEISDEDADAVGILAFTKDGKFFKYWCCDPVDDHPPKALAMTWQDMPHTRREAAKALYQAIYGEEAWERNDWAWALDFGQVEFGVK